jgi:hypothetical protein
MNKQTPSRKSSPEPTPPLLPTLDEIEAALKGVDLWEMDKPPEVVAQAWKERRPWFASKDLD